MNRSIKQKVEQITSQYQSISECLEHLKADFEKVYFLDDQISKLNTNAHIVALLGRRKMTEDIVNQIKDLQKMKSQILNRRTP